MKLLTVDDYQRVRLPGVKPRQHFSFNPNADGSLLLVPVKEVKDDVPVVQPIRTKEGFLLLPVKLDSKTVAAAIRKDRDAR